jgi:MHS family citrate/tricarballylate:H+ symporter-like MFS transporter
MADISFDALLSVEADGPSTMRPRHVAAVVIGNALEFYDFLIFSYFAVYIGQAFFPAQGTGSGLLLSLATFGVGFLTRPVGAVVIGSMGDRVGRRPAMLLSFTLMGVGIVGLALTPSYARIGVAAPVLVLVFRLLQGFALGGEMGPATAFLTEAAPRDKRGFYTAMQMSSQMLAQLLAGLVGTGLAILLTPEALSDWGWRLAMLIGAAVIPFGLLIRRDLPETLHASVEPAPPAPASRKFGASGKSDGGGASDHAGLIALGLMLVLAGTIGTYVAAYMTTYALTTLHMAATMAFGIVIARSLVAIPVTVTSGWLSDKFGRKPLMLAPGVLLFASIVPVFRLIVDRHDATTLYAGMIWLAILAGLAGPPILVTISESLPKHIRSGTLAIVYAVATSVFGGSTQFIVAWLIGVTGDALAPAYYWTGALAIGLMAMVLIKESAPCRQGAK